MTDRQIASGNVLFPPFFFDASHMTYWFQDHSEEHIVILVLFILLDLYLFGIIPVWIWRIYFLQKNEWQILEMSLEAEHQCTTMKNFQIYFILPRKKIIPLFYSFFFSLFNI